VTPPTLRQRVRSAIRMFARAEGDGLAAMVTIEEAVAEIGADTFRSVAVDVLALHDGRNGSQPVPAQATVLEITREQAEALLRDVAQNIEEGGDERFADDVRDAIEVLSMTLPPIMGAKDAAEMLGMAVPNLRKLSPPLEPVAVVSGRIPLFLRSDVEAVARRRAAR
jgi:hypothetical protein